MGVCSTAWTCSTWTPCRGATSAVQVGPLHNDHCLFEKVVASLHTRSMWYSYIPDVVIEVWILGWYSRKNIVMIRECCEKYEAVERQRRGWAGRFLTASHSGRCSTFPSYYFSQIGRQRRICTFPNNDWDAARIQSWLDWDLWAKFNIVSQAIQVLCKNILYFGQIMCQYYFSG